MNEGEKMNEQELLVNIQILREQAKIIASNVEMLSVYLQELASAKATLEGVKLLKKGDEILVPIGGASFIRARIDDTEGVIIGVGANVSVDRTLTEAISVAEEKINFTQSKISENQEAYMKVTSTLEELSDQAQDLLREKGENV